MTQNIKTASVQFLLKTLGKLDIYENFVFWIRDRHMTTQIYQGSNFQKIWQRDPNLMFKYPLLWFDYLEKNNKEFYMSQLQTRHDQYYCDPNKNYAIYQIITLNGNLNFIFDHCIKCIDAHDVYIVGMAKQISRELWYKMFNKNIYIQTKSDLIIQKKLFLVLKKYFGIVKWLPSTFNIVKLQQFFENILTECVSLTKREVECLYYLCLGKTGKEIAKEMLISPRTIETYIDQIRNKTGYANRLEIISHFAKYCSAPLP